MTVRSAGMALGALLACAGCRSIIGERSGGITYPESWGRSAGLVAGCAPSGGVPRRRGYDLVDGTALAPALADAAIGVVLSTAIPGAMWRGGYVFDAVVLRY